jgi:hypothetical protein
MSYDEASLNDFQPVTATRIMLRHTIRFARFFATEASPGVCARAAPVWIRALNFRMPNQSADFVRHLTDNAKGYSLIGGTIGTALAVNYTTSAWVRTAVFAARVSQLSTSVVDDQPRKGDGNSIRSCQRTDPRPGEAHGEPI